MSENISTASKTINTKLTTENFFATSSGEFTSWLSFNVKILFTIFVFCLILSSLMSLFPININETERQMLFSPPKMRCPCKARCPCRNQTCPCKHCRMLEEFSNNELYAYNSSQYSDYQSIPLLAPFDQFKNPENLLFGQANRQIYLKNNTKIFNLEIYCNLFVLDGNVYNVSKNIKHSYKVYLLNDKTKTKMYLDDLKKDGDGIYKLKMKSENVQELVQFNHIVIVYSLNNKEQIILQGQFK